MIIEFIGGVLINSIVIMVDVVYDFGDSLFIGLVWVFVKLGKKFVFSLFFYGYKCLLLLGLFINGIVFIVGLGWVLY